MATPPASTLQPGIGDRNDLLLRIQSVAGTGTTPSQYMPELHQGSYLLVSEAQASMGDPLAISEFSLYSNPSTAAYVTALANTLSSTTLPNIPDTSQPPCAIIGMVRLLSLPSITQLETPLVESYGITCTVNSITGSVLTFTDGTAANFPRNTTEGFTCWQVNAPATLYTVASMTTNTITITGTPGNTTTPSPWMFQVNAVRLFYPNGTPKINQVIIFTIDGSVPLLQVSTSYYYDVSGWLIVAPTIALTTPCSVNYYPDESCALEQNSTGAWVFNCYYSTGGTIEYFYQILTVNSYWRTFPSVNLNPLVAGATEGFLYLDSYVPTPATTTFAFSPPGGIIPVENSMLETVHILAYLSDTNNNPISNQPINWYYQIASGQNGTGTLGTPTSCALGTPLVTAIAAGITAIDGTVGAAVGNDFFSAVGMTHTSTSSIRFLLYIGTSPATGTLATSASSWLSPLAINAQTSSPYIHIVATPTTTAMTVPAGLVGYDIAVWVEGLTSSVWIRQGAKILTISQVDTYGNITAVTDNSGNSSFVTPSAFPNAVILPATLVLPGSLLFATCAGVQSNLVTIAG